MDIVIGRGSHKNTRTAAAVPARRACSGRVLFDLCLRENPRSWRIGSAADIAPGWIRDGDRGGVCGATSTPKWLLEEVASSVRG